MWSVTAALLIYAAEAFFPGQVGAEGRTGSVVFERNDRLLTWQNANSGSFSLRPDVHFSFENALSTSLSMTSGSTLPDRWYDRVFTSARVDYDLTERLGLNVNMREEWNKDTMSRLGNSFLTADYGGTLSYRPFSGFDARGTVGRIHDRRYENRDDGTTASGDIRYAGTPVGSLRNLTTMVEVSGGTSTMKRTNDTAHIRSAVAWENPVMNVAAEYTDNSAVRGYFAESRSESGVEERKDIEQRTTTDRTMTLRLFRGVLSEVQAAPAFEMRMNIGGRQVTDSANDKDPSSPKYHTNSQGNLKDFSVRYGGSLGKLFRGEWESGYSRDENNVQRAVRSRTQTDVSTRGSLTVLLSRSDSLAVIGWIKRMRIDTPREVHNDRDELKIESGTKYTRRLGDTCNMALDFRLLKTHYVNIDVTQSSQNKWMNTYQLSPSFLYRPFPELNIRHEVGLQANYIDFDFDRGANPRSTITRRVSSETWVTGELTAGTDVIAGVMFEDNDYGRMNLRGNRIPAEEGIRRFLDLSVRYVYARWLILVPRYVYAIRKDRSVERGTLERREIDQTFGMDIRLFENNRGDGHDCVMGLKRIVRYTLRNAPEVRNYITITLTYGF
jgi:hypothetical protein